jgi:hypothetical protein
MRTWPYQRLTGRLEAASALPRGDLQGEGGIGGSEATDAAQMLGTSSAEDSRLCRTTQQSNEQLGVRDEKNVEAIMLCYAQFSASHTNPAHQASRGETAPSRTVLLPGLRSPRAEADLPVPWQGRDVADRARVRLHAAA